jgi:hypothetical protein
MTDSDEQRSSWDQHMQSALQSPGKKIRSSLLSENRQGVAQAAETAREDMAISLRFCGWLESGTLLADVGGFPVI